ncbi:rhodanese-like domain-containing protein [Halanaerobiaceae bacterium Z-7014]|uniref:Rhodanese-like domain-containing protein n=1 Tax=Halonatronomonas betaini TaxID=2778430 RepID=A0A931AQV9_9FIRM|nr:rhodanese-like domain-containing protein [Halonatronomonas betaini]MBF8437287.1 rhodanese-like domain-containing protein [Halonatronomonas betaini]
MKRKLFVGILAVMLVMGLSLNVSADVLSGGDLVEELSEDLEREMGVRELKAAMDDGEEYIILDVRSTAERNEGFIPGSEYVNFGILFFRIGDFVEDPDQEFIVACQSGARSVIAAVLLQDMGYKPINLAGGFNAWETFEFEVEMP